MWCKIDFKRNLLHAVISHNIKPAIAHSTLAILLHISRTINSMFATAAIKPAEVIAAEHSTASNIANTTTIITATAAVAIAINTSINMLQD